jgi:hypothetical protein
MRGPDTICPPRTACVESARSLDAPVTISSSWAAASAHALPGDDDLGPFRPLEVLQRAIAAHDEMKFLARAHVTDPVREGRPLDAIAAQLPVFIVSLR